MPRREKLTGAAVWPDAWDKKAPNSFQTLAQNEPLQNKDFYSKKLLIKILGKSWQNVAKLLS
jgi:5'-3' exonuclease